MIKEASGPINFTVFLTMFGEKLKGMNVQTNDEKDITKSGIFTLRSFRNAILTPLMFLGADPEETILNAFKVFDPEGKGVLRKDE